MKPIPSLLAAGLALLPFVPAVVMPARGGQPGLFDPQNLTAWCVVPFDARKRGPEARAEMLQRLGFKNFAYDWRAVNVPAFDGEIEAMKRHGIKIVAWWFPEDAGDPTARTILEAIKRHDIHPQLWVMGAGGPTKTAAEQKERVEQEAGRIHKIVPAQPDISQADMKALADFLFLRDRPMPPARPKGERPSYSAAGYPRFLDLNHYPACKPPWGTLDCLDLNSGKLLWKVPLGEYPELAGEGVPKTGTENFGGAIVTAGGLVFCAGTRDTKIRAFDENTGAELWSAKLPWGGSAPPACYEVNGREFVVIPATGGGKLATPVGDAYVAYALPATSP